jgi:glycosyltransferase involved in cell wall biosynthesis
MFKGKKISVVMPAYNEEENIFRAVTEFKTNPYVDEVLVVNNNSTDKTKDLAIKAGAKVVDEEKQGYGFACQRALREADGDYIVLVEPDGTFDARDIEKFLVYSDDFDLVLGTRTSKELIWAGANMGTFLKWGNWGLGKLIEIIYNGPNLSDVGCTYRLIKKNSLKKIQGEFTVGGSQFSPEMIILAIKKGIRTIEIPVNYKPRKGSSKITGKKKDAFILGLKMFKLIAFSKFKGEKS